jgi:hypothetical protein
MAPTGKMPEFLSGCEEYVRYLQLAPEMKLPEYEQVSEVFQPRSSTC